jgi:hypothetical protein
VVEGALGVSSLQSGPDFFLSGLDSDGLPPGFSFERFADEALAGGSDGGDQAAVACGGDSRPSSPLPVDLEVFAVDLAAGGHDPATDVGLLVQLSGSLIEGYQAQDLSPRTSYGHLLKDLGDIESQSQHLAAHEGSVHLASAAAIGSAVRAIPHVARAIASGYQALQRLGPGALELLQDLSERV